MFGRLHLLLASACLAVLFGEVFSELQRACNYANVGNLIGTAVSLPTVSLNGYPDWTVQVPTIPQCQLVKGVYAEVCDYDVAPDANFDSMSTLKVHRKGQLAKPGSVTITVYCY